MMILRAFFKNMSIINVHLVVFTLKSAIIFLSLLPLKLAMQMFFSGKTINDDMFAGSDLNAFHEFFRVFVTLDLPWFAVPQYLSIILVSIVVSIFLLFLFIDGFIDAGILHSLEHAHSDSFYAGMRKFGRSFVGLRLLNASVYFFLLGISFAIVSYFYLSKSFIASFIVFTVLAILFMFALKIFDHGKYLILRDKKKPARAFIIAFKSVLKDRRQTLLLNIQTLLVFYTGFFIYLLIDDILIVDSTHKIGLMVVLHQIALFGKQILRYTYMAGIGKVIYNGLNNRAIIA